MRTSIKLVFMALVLYVIYINATTAFTMLYEVGNSVQSHYMQYEAYLEN